MQLLKTNGVGWVISGVVLLLLFVVGVLLKPPVLLLLSGETARGLVVAIDASPYTGRSQSSEPVLMYAPVVEFGTSAGEHVRVTGRTHLAAPSSHEGDAVLVVYNPLHPKGAELLLLSEFIPAVSMLGFVGFILLIWISVVLISGDDANGDPLHLLPAVIARLRLNPARFPVFLVLSAAILCSVTGTYVFTSQALDLHFNGVKARGQVSGYGRYSEIAFKDAAGTSYTIRGTDSRGPLAYRPDNGDQAEVIYLPGQADQAVRNAWSELWLLPLVFGLFTLAFIGAFRFVLNSTADAATIDPEREIRLKTTGVPMIATVIEAKPTTRFLHFRLDKDPKIPDADLNGFEAAEQTLHDWQPSQSALKIQRGTQFRAYLNLRKPGAKLKFYIDFGERIGFKSHVESIEEEEESSAREDKELHQRLSKLVTTSAPFLTQHGLSEIGKLIALDDLELAFEKLITMIMNMPKPLPTPLKKINWHECFKLGADLGLDEGVDDNAQSGCDPEFWAKFRIFKNRLK